MFRRLLRMPGVPALLVSVVPAVAFAVWDPPLRDLAAHTFRAELFEQQGIGIWNGSWYGGHYVPTYSVLFPPLAAALGPVWAGVLAAVSCAYLFDRLAFERWGPAARPAGLWFAALGPVALLANGWLAFALGAALALACLRALQGGRPAAACALGAACGLGSPVAAFLLALVLVAGSAAERREGWLWHGVAPAACALAPVAALALVFPEESGRFPLWFSAYWPLALTCAGILAIIRRVPEERPVRWVTVAYLAVGTALWLAPNPIGGNVTRLGSLFAGPVLAAILLARRPVVPRALAVAVLALALGWQVVTPLPDTIQSLGDPSTERAYYEPLSRWLDANGGRTARIEIPYTFNHWETAYVSPRFSLARGWLRQLDRARNEVFYEGRLTDRRYLAWLREKAVRFVALPDSELDYSAEEEADLVRAKPPYLRLRATPGRWRVYEVRDATPIVSGPPGARAHLTSLGTEAFELAVDRPGRYLVRVEPTAYRRLDRGAGCVGRERGWTLVRADRTGRLRASVGFSADGAWNALTGATNDCR